MERLVQRDLTLGGERRERFGVPGDHADDASEVLALVVRREGLDGELPRKGRDVVLGGTDPLATHLDDLAAADLGVERTAADAVPRLQDDDITAGVVEVERGGQTREPRAHHHDVRIP